MKRTKKDAEETKRLPGRPNLGLETRMEIQVTPALLDLVTRASAAAGIKRAEWMRKAALYYLAGGAPAVVPELADDDAEAP